MCNKMLYLAAVVIESFSGREHDLNGINTLTYCVMYTAEECLEMLGVSLFYICSFVIFFYFHKNWKLVFIVSRVKNIVNLTKKAP